MRVLNTLIIFVLSLTIMGFAPGTTIPEGQPPRRPMDFFVYLPLLVGPPPIKAITGLTAANSGPVVHGTAVFFTATISEGNNVAYAWNFGDGNTGVGAQTSHTYASAGTYTATVTATNPSGSASANTQVVVHPPPFSCPTSSVNSYLSHPIYQTETDNPPRPAYNHADKNLQDLRGYQAAPAGNAKSFNILSISTPDPQMPPQLGSLFNPARIPVFNQVYQINNWNWANSPEPGTRGDPVTDPPITALGLQTTQGETIYAPTHAREPSTLLGVGGSLVLFADADSLTLHMEPKDSAAEGYTVHIIGLCTDPNLLALYTSLDTGNRYIQHNDPNNFHYDLPGVKAGQPLGVARAGEVVVAIVDTGTSQDPRVCDTAQFDWWDTVAPTCVYPH